MADLSYENMSERLADEHRQLLAELVDAHLAAAADDREFLTTTTAAGTRLHLPKGGTLHVGPSTINDLSEYGFLRVVAVDRFQKRFEVRHEAVRFMQWLRTHDVDGVQAVEQHVRLRMLDGLGVSRTHPSVMGHLQKAEQLLWAGRTDDQTVSELGGHLRSALIDALPVDRQSGPEDLGKRLDRWFASLGPSRSEGVLAALVTLTKQTQSLNQRLTHVRDDTLKGGPVAWDEMRRATFITVLCCYELIDAVRSR